MTPETTIAELLNLWPRLPGLAGAVAGAVLATDRVVAGLSPGSRRRTASGRGDPGGTAPGRVPEIRRWLSRVLRTYAFGPELLGPGIPETFPPVTPTRRPEAWTTCSTPPPRRVTRTCSLRTAFRCRNASR